MGYSRLAITFAAVSFALAASACQADSAVRVVPASQPSVPQRSSASDVRELITALESEGLRVSESTSSASPGIFTDGSFGPAPFSVPLTELGPPFSLPVYAAPQFVAN